MLEIWYLSSLYAQFRLLIVYLKTIWTEDYADETFHISISKRNNDYVVGLFKYFFHIPLVFLDALRTRNHSLKKMLMKSCKIIQVYITITFASFGLIFFPVK